MVVQFHALLQDQLVELQLSVGCNEEDGCHAGNHGDGHGQLPD